MVMATDGLWDKLTSDEVVQLVGDLLDGKTGQEELVLNREESSAYRKNLQSIREQQVAASGSKIEQEQQEDEEITPVDLAPKGPASQVRKFTFRDHAHASTHLIRNALGGADDDKVAATLSIPSPMSRRYRDDISGNFFACLLCCFDFCCYTQMLTNLSLCSHGHILWAPGQQNDSF